MDLKSYLAQMVKKSEQRKLQRRRQEEEEEVSKKNQLNKSSGRSINDDHHNQFDDDSNRSYLRSFSIRLDKLNWQSRITIILSGTCLLFSLFFTLDFLIHKILTVLALQQSFQQASHINAHTNGLFPTEGACLAQSRVNWTYLSEKSTIQHKREDNNSTYHKQQMPTKPSVNKLGVNFEIIYENQLKLSQNQDEYKIESFGDSSKIDSYPINAQLNLGRILEAYHEIMPFNPDIWLFSEPEKSLHLLWGDLNRCTLDLDEILSKFEEKIGVNKNAFGVLGVQNLKLMRFLDSFGRPESGTLIGHPFWLGSYLECQLIGSKIESKILIELDKPKRVLETRYCVGKLRFNSWPQKEDVSIKVGLCLPKHCDSLALFKENQLMKKESLEPIEQLRRRIERLLFLNFDEKLYKREELSLVDVYCLPVEETRHFGVSAFMLILFILAWLSTCAYCTWLRHKRKANNANNKQQQVEEATTTKFFNNSLIEIMAIDVNLEEFVFPKKVVVDESKRKQIVNLNVLDSVKHFGCIGVISAHVLLTYLTLGTSYNHIVDHIGKDMRTMLLLSLNNVVDTFFVISGILVAYLMFKKLNNSSSGKKELKQHEGSSKVKKRIDIIIFKYTNVVASRYLRMAPLYFLVYAWTKCISVHLGSGPLWDYASNKQSLRALCQRESWLWPILFASDFKPITEHCVPPAWSIAVDLQFFLVLPLFIWLLKKSTKIGYSVIVGLIMITTLYTFSQYKSLFDYISLADFAKLRLHVFTLLIKYAASAYSHPQNRIGPILIGLIGGHMLHDYETKRNKMRKQQQQQRRQVEDSQEEEEEEEELQLWPNWMLGRWFRAVILLNLTFIFAPTIVQLRERFREAALEDGIISSSLFGLISRRIITFLLALNTSTNFDCNLALGGFVFIKPLWSICNCILFLRLATDLNKTLVGRLMSLDIWHKISKLNYAILLIHFEFISFEAMSRLSLSPITWPQLVCKFSFAYLCSVCAALPLHVLLEQPAHKLTRKLLR